MGLLEPTHLIIILVIALLLFGPKKIPDLMRGIGKGMGELQKGIADGKAALNHAMQEIHHDPEPEVTVPEKVATTTPVEPEIAVEPNPAPKKAKRVKSV